MSMKHKCNLNKTINMRCFDEKKDNNLSAQKFIQVIPFPINFKCPAMAWEKEKAKNVTFVKELRKEAKEARLRSLYDTDNSGKIKFKTRREHIKEFIRNTLSDSTFVTVD